MSDETSRQTDTLLKKFDQEGLISEKEVALCFMLKKESKNKAQENFNGFFVHANDNPKFYDIVKKMTESGKSFEFQFAYKEWGGENEPEGHWTSGMMRFDGDTNKLKVFLCDPLGADDTEVLYQGYLGAGGFDFNELSTLHNLEIYLSTDKLQVSEKGCSYFAIDNAYMLASQHKYDDIFDYMKAHNKKTEQEENITIYHSSLPIRLKRQQQSLSSLEKSLLSDEEYASKIVNRKGESAKESINKNTKERRMPLKDKPLQFTPKLINHRMGAKRERLKEKIKIYMDSIGTQPEGLSQKKIIEEACKQNGLEGLEAYANRIMSSKPDINP